MKMSRRWRQVNEGLDWVVEAKKPEEQVARLKEWASSNQALVPIIRHGVGAEKAEWGIPEGMPETAKIQDDIPEGMGETTLTLEWRRVKNFFDPNSSLKKLPLWKQEMNWLQILEGIHHKEAAILTAVKDGTLLQLYPTLEKCLPLLGIEEYNKPVKKKRASKKKS